MNYEGENREEEKRKKKKKKKKTWLSIAADAEKSERGLERRASAVVKHASTFAVLTS